MLLPKAPKIYIHNHMKKLFPVKDKTLNELKERKKKMFLHILSYILFSNYFWFQVQIFYFAISLTVSFSLTIEMETFRKKEAWKNKIKIK